MGSRRAAGGCGAWGVGYAPARARGLDKQRAQNALRLTYRRYGQNLPANVTERLEIYNFNTGSYPYGSFTTVFAAPVPSSYLTSVASLPDPGQYISFEDDLFLRIVVEGAGGEARLLIDQLLVEWDESP